MFEIGFWELIVVGVVALIVVGPEQLPGLARKGGFWLGKARRMIAEVKADVDRELHLEELKQTLRQQADLREVKELADEVKSFRHEVEKELDDPGPPPGWRPGMPTAAPPSDWTPPATSRELPAAASPAPVQSQKPDSAAPAPRSVATPTVPPSAAPPSQPSPPPAAN
jgi:sec-independent protein translocase protein TatB